MDFIKYLNFKDHNRNIINQLLINYQLDRNTKLTLKNT